MMADPRSPGAEGRQFPSLAVIGCGGVAAERHLPALAQLGWRPHVLVDPRTERAQKLARRYKAHRVVADVSELAGGEIAAALVATNSSSHARLSLALLERGIQVFVEKPLATNEADAQALVQAAAAKSLCLAVGHMRRFLFVNRWVKALVDSGALGDILGFDFREGSSYHRQPGGRLTAARAARGTGPYSPAFWDRKAAGGGVLLDMGAHTLDVLLWWLGDGRLLSYSDDSLGGVECDALLQLALLGGATGRVELSRSRTLRNTAIITGSRGEIEVALHRNAIVRAHPENLVGFELDGRSGATMPDEQLHGDLFKRELQDWLRALRSGAEPFVSGASAAAAVGLIDGCYRNRRPLPQSWVRRLQGTGQQARAGGGRLQGRRVLVTGASGFIGGRLTEKLVLQEGAQVRAAVRTLRNAARISRLPAEAVELRRFDMADGKIAGSTMDALVEGCDAVFHLARDSRSQRANEKGTRSLGAACLRAGVRRLVHVSSLGVYAPLPDAPLSEESPIGRRPRYDKLAAEREVLRMAGEDGLPAAVIQPTIVYGPFSREWTDRPAELLLKGQLIVPAPGDGICNAVYVDDLIQALILAAERDAAVGETFLISGPEHPTWLDFYRAYERALGGGIRLMDQDEMRRRHRDAGGLLALPTPKQLLGYRPLRPLREALIALYDRLGDRGRATAKRFYEQGRLSPSRKANGPAEFLPHRFLLDLYTAKCQVEIGKARRLLGYEPEFDLERGMKRTVDYLQWAHGQG